MTSEQWCVECGDQPATLLCENCKDIYCEVCFGALHRRGKRFNHHWKELKDETKSRGVDSDTKTKPEEKKEKDKSKDKKSKEKDTKMKEKDTKEKDTKEKDTKDKEKETKEKEKAKEKKKDDEDLSAMDNMEVNVEWFTEDPTPEWFTERAKYIPLRLSDEERMLLNLVESCMDVSEYTDKVDVWTYHGKEKRIVEQLMEICRTLCGLRIAADHTTGKKLVVGKNFKDNAEFFQHLFEVGRRHKIRNPEKMRTEYGKLMWLLQDSQDEDIQAKLGFSMVSDIKTVYSFLTERKALDLLADKLMPLATGEIITEGKPREDIDKAVKAKQDAMKRLCQKYKRDGLSDEDIKLCLLSIGDNHSFLRSNRDPVDQMLGYLVKNFRHDSVTGKWSLAISSGQGGSCLTHDHRTQFFFVFQSLTLWRDILHDMFRLWYLAEQDLLDPALQYRLRNTGQGLNRMQYCPRIGRAMSAIVGACHQKVSRWVGLSVVHLGDRDVPNALVFIDKYNQVARILTPIVTCIRELDRLYTNPQLKGWIDKVYGGLETLRMTILTDFFRHAFDGSGDDGGSCIDGRLTSSWNWCSRLEKKSYYPVFLLTGFVGFDGTF